MAQEHLPAEVAEPRRLQVARRALGIGQERLDGLIPGLALDQVGRAEQPALVVELDVQPRRQQQHELVEAVGLVLDQMPDGPGAERGADGYPRAVRVGDRAEVPGEVREPVAGLG